MKDRFNNAVGPQVRAARQGPGKAIPLFATLSIVAGLQAATQFFAHDFNYQAALGANIQHIYPPWAIVHWAVKWHSEYPNAVMRAGNLGVAIASAGLPTLTLVRMVLANSTKLNEYLHGSARWANIRDIRAAGLLPRPRTLLQTLSGKPASVSSGVYVGAWLDKGGKQHYLRHNGPEHVLCYAPTRSGKGVGLVVPTLPSWSESAVITDLKGELWALTAGWRRKYAKNKVLRFEPATATGCICWNPLDEIRLGTENEVGVVQNHRHLARRSGRQGLGESLAEDKPGAPGRRHPARSVQGSRGRYDREPAQR